ncbi:adenosylmethionine decarboxylase [Butyrivibrio proteoclasticus]|uniref:adenosylmethionine decarboxylase n=1 Tax=Butyrivibrio proteoclasticus TaxID=43305 RepID=UPI00047BCC6F|nr:adenosylmethionine decarboxylase [Butyrivibrio proteoclasticus]
MAIQVVSDFYGCDSEILDDEKRICSIAKEAIEQVGAEIVEECVHKFSPIGITYFAVISTSHFSIHTWPEYGYAAVDVFSCSDFVVEELTALLQKAFKADRVETQKLNRKVGR